MQLMNKCIFRKTQKQQHKIVEPGDERVADGGLVWRKFGWKPEVGRMLGNSGGEILNPW